MEATQLHIKGKHIKVPAFLIQGSTVAITGRWLRTAAVKDEEWTEQGAVQEPESFVADLKKASSDVDIFTFFRGLNHTKPQFGYYFEWDNFAAIPIQSYQEWWDGLSQDARRNVRLSEKRGISVREVEFDEPLVRGMKALYDETPIRQGRRFWHYGKKIEQVRNENATYLERSKFIGAYLSGELIGFVKIVAVGGNGHIMQILTKTTQHDKRPANALVAKSVELCAVNRLKHLVYLKYTYGNKTNSSITEFKRRNGFKEIRFPRYYVPLTRKGKIALKLGLHLSYKRFLPAGVVASLLAVRSRVYEQILLRRAIKAELGTQPQAVR